MNNPARPHADRRLQKHYQPNFQSKQARDVRINEDLTQAIDARRGVMFALLDLRAAFDTLDHAILL